MLKEFQELLELPAWSRLCKMAEAQMQQRQQQLLLPMHERTVPNAERLLPTDEFLKGESAGIKLFLNLPSIITDSAKAVIENEENANGNTRDNANGASAS